MLINKLCSAFRASLAVSHGFLRRLHHDDRGSMSIVSVFTVMFLAMLLGMMMNAGRQVDGKIRMQNAADSAAYSGGVVLARGMNTLAFTNNLLCDVFALTAFLREARDQNAASYAPQILAAWNKVGKVFAKASFPKFRDLGTAIEQKAPLEKQMVDTYSAWAKAVSDEVLPVMEQILSEELIPKYQRAVVVAFPEIAQIAARETASRNGTPDYGRGTMFGVLWRTDVKPVGGDAESSYSPDDRTLPVVDPELDSVANQDEYVQTAQKQRYALAHMYLDEWNIVMLNAFDQVGKMSQFANLYRTFDCGYLEDLLNKEYPRTNLPMVIREELTPTVKSGDAKAALEKHYIYIGVVYWKKLREDLPGLFKNPLQPDSQAFAEVHLFIPRNRLEFVLKGQAGSSGSSIGGGVPGETVVIPISPPQPVGPVGPPPPGGGGTSPEPEDSPWTVGRVGGPMAFDPLTRTWYYPWNLINQSWNCQLAPATQSALPEILQTYPNVTGFSPGQFKLPNLGGLSSDDLQQISPH